MSDSRQTRGHIRGNKFIHIYVKPLCTERKFPKTVVSSMIIQVWAFNYSMKSDEFYILVSSTEIVQ